MVFKHRAKELLRCSKVLLWYLRIDRVDKRKKVNAFFAPSVLFDIRVARFCLCCLLGSLDWSNVNVDEPASWKLQDNGRGE